MRQHAHKKDDKPFFDYIKKGNIAKIITLLNNNKIYHVPIKRQILILKGLTMSFDCHFYLRALL